MKWLSRSLCCASLQTWVWPLEPQKFGRGKQTPQTFTHALWRTLRCQHTRQWWRTQSSSLKVQTPWASAWRKVTLLSVREFLLGGWWEKPRGTGWSHGDTRPPLCRSEGSPVAKALTSIPTQLAIGYFSIDTRVRGRGNGHSVSALLLSLVYREGY